MAGESREIIVGEDDPGLDEVPRAKWVTGDDHIRTFWCHRLENSERFVDDFGADTVSGNDGETQGGHENRLSARPARFSASPRLGRQAFVTVIGESPG